MAADQASPAAAADHALRVAQAHPECVGGRVSAADEVEVDLRVEMPLQMKADGISDTGVRTIETVTLRLPPEYPWRSPRIRLRNDFPRNFPHLFPGAKGSAPRPCLVEGDQDEFFLQFGLVEYGLFHLIEQAALWLRKAATRGLMDPSQGWEPAVRRGLADILAFDADAARGSLLKQGGYLAWRARFVRCGEPDVALGSGATAWIDSKAIKVPLKSADLQLFTSSAVKAGASNGNTVVGIIWPDKPAAGGAPINDRYMPDDVSTLVELRERADLLGCRRGLDLFVSNLERCWHGSYLERPIPIGVVLCTERPFALVGSTSPIELLPYILEVRPYNERSSLFAAGDLEPVMPAIHYQTLAPSLLRALSSTPDRPPLAMLGCGSVGSKLAIHAARAGQTVVALADIEWLRPHNMARHALYPARWGTRKADALATELAGFGPRPTVFTDDLPTALLDPARRSEVVPAEARIVVNTTASLAVREALAAGAHKRERARPVEAALFGRGRMGYLLIAGERGAPDHNDLTAELYAATDDPDAAALLADPVSGLAEVQVGQGCGSLTMTVDDAQLSMMTAGLAKELGHAIDHPRNDGLIVTGVTGADNPSTRWSRRVVPPFEVVAIDGSDGWHVRISARIAERIRCEAAEAGGVETGGLLIGLSSARLRTVTVVDLLEAPADSVRSATLFVLGTQGMKQMIAARHRTSGRTLFDVGTWHTHLTDHGPSRLDWSTAAKLAAERAPPSILLIATPRRFHALIAKGDAYG